MDMNMTEITTDGGQRVRMEVDHSKTVEEKIPIARTLASDGKLDEALDVLLGLEKLTRTGADMHSTSKVLVCIVQMCFEAKNWTLLNEQILLLSKKRSQLKQSVAKMVQECSSWILNNKLPNLEIEIQLIETLRTVTSGKIYVEVERARLTHRLAKIQEDDGDVQKAAKTMLELQVETYGSMEREEKVKLILEQMRLCLAVKDFIRTQIISKKISIKFFENKDYQDLKLVFYRYMIEMDEHELAYLKISTYYKAVYDTPCIQENEEMKLHNLKRIIIFAILAPYDNEQSDLIARIRTEKPLLKLPVHKNLLEQFTNYELIEQQKFVEIFEDELKKGTVDIFDGKTEAGRQRWSDLKKRVSEHNIRILSRYYTKISLERMASLLSLSEAETENFLSHMVVDQTVDAKTDRLDGVVNFGKQDDPNEILNKWSFSISELLSLVLKTTHLVNKEEMLHKHMVGAAATSNPPPAAGN